MTPIAIRMSAINGFSGLFLRINWYSVSVKTLAETPPPLSKNRSLRRGGFSMNEIQILEILRIWTIFRAPAAREEKLAIFALRNHPFVFKNPKIFARLRRPPKYTFCS